MATKYKRPKKKVSFVLDSVGFNYTPSTEQSPIHGDDPHWNTFGRLSKSQYSFMSDASSFAGSLNTISETNLWLVDEEQEDEKLDKLPPSDNPAFTFGAMSKSRTKPNRSPSIPSIEHKHTKSSRSITFSATVSLYTDSEKRQNSVLFYDLWGVAAGTTRADRSRSDASQLSDTSQASLTEYSPQTYHQKATSLSGVIRKQSTMVGGPIYEDDEEEWSDYDIDMENSEYATDDASQTKGWKYRKRKSTLTNDFVFGRRKSTEILSID